MRYQRSLLLLVVLCLWAGFPDAVFAELMPGERRAQVIEAIALGAQGLDILQGGLSDPDSNVRLAAARGVMQLGDVAGDLTARTLGHDDPAIRAAALAELVRLNRQPPEQLYQRMLADPDPRVQQQVAPLVARVWDLLPGEPDALLAMRVEPGSDTRFIQVGPHGIALEIEPGDGSARVRRGGLIDNHPALVPPGAMSLELVFRPRPELAEQAMAYLVDMMGITGTSQGHRCNYRISLHRQADLTQRVAVTLGFGHQQDLATWRSEPVTLDPQRWHHLIFSYDGNGSGQLYLDGQLLVEQTFQDKGPVAFGANGYNHLVLGDRSISNYRAFPGQIGLLRIHTQPITP